MKLIEIINEDEFDQVRKQQALRREEIMKSKLADPDSWEAFQYEIEQTIDDKMTKDETREAYRSWDVNGEAAKDVARWIKSDRDEKSFNDEFGQDANMDMDYEDDMTDDDYTDYSMRQGEMGNPDYR